MASLWVALGASVGAPMRYLIDRAVRAWHPEDYPWGTLAVNLIGSLLLGGLVAAAARLPTAALVTLDIGLCGALTTYSTFGYETLRLLESQAYFHAVANVLTSLFAGLGAAGIGWALGTALAR